MVNGDLGITDDGVKRCVDESNAKCTRDTSMCICNNHSLTHGAYKHSPLLVASLDAGSSAHELPLSPAIRAFKMGEVRHV